MSKSKSKKPRRASKTLTARKAIQKGNEQLLDKVRDIVLSTEKKVSETAQQLFQNQQQLHKGLSTSEEHILLMRRVLNDAVCGIVKEVTVERPVFGSDDKETVQVIDWGWYTAQMDFADNREKFMLGMVLPDEEIESRIEKKRRLSQLKVLDACTTRLTNVEEDKMRELVEDKDRLSARIVDFMAEQMKIDKKDIEFDDELSVKAVEMTKAKLLALDEKRKEEAQKQEEMKKAGEKLVEETEDFANVAGKAVKAIQEGDDEAAAEAFDEMEQRVEAKEKEADAQPPKDDGFPDGAAIFGGE